MVKTFFFFFLKGEPPQTTTTTMSLQKISGTFEHHSQTKESVAHVFFNIVYNDKFYNDVPILTLTLNPFYTDKILTES